MCPSRTASESGLGPTYEPVSARVSECPSEVPNGGDDDIVDGIGDDKVGGAS